MSPPAPHLGHVHLKVRDVERSVEFYTAVLDLDVNDRYGGFAFLSFGEHHHDVALQGLGPDAPGPSQGVGLYHAAFEVDSRDALQQVYERLRERGVDATPVDHGISEALYFADPDGNGLEIYRDTRAERDRTEWGGMNEPFDPMES
jgi:catechol 2,3-dioxygenase